MPTTRWFALLPMLFICAPVAAQDPDFTRRTPTFDMQMPATSVATSPGMLSLTTNPAGLSWLGSRRAVNMLYLHQERLDVDDGTQGVFTGRADGLLLGMGRLGFGLQYIRPYDDDDSWDYLKYTLAVPLMRSGHWLSVGAGVEILDPTETNEDPSVDFFAGALIRPFRYVSLGLAGRNLGRAQIHGARANRILDLGVAVRPLWFAPERVTLAVDFRLIEQVEDPPIRFTGHFSFLDGIGVFGTADLDGNFGAGVMVDFQRVGAGGYLDFVNASDVEPGNMLLMARVSTDLQPGFVVGKERTAEFRLDHELTTDPREAWGLFRNRPTLHGFIHAIHGARRDERVDSLLLRVENPELEFSDVQEIREALAEFKAAGKKVFFHLEYVNNLTYYLATAGDAIYVDPVTRVSVTGPRVEAMFFRGTLDMLGVRVNVQKIGKYKNAPDRFTREEPSEGHREVMNSLATETADQMIAAVAEARGLSREEVVRIVDRGIMLPAQARELGLVDGVMYFDDVNEPISKQLNHAVSRVSGYGSRKVFRDRWGNLPTIAVVYASGAIGMGDLFGRNMNAREIAELLSDLRRSPRVDAVVLRVDSPGGGIHASDVIWREVKRLKKRKPVVVSMGPLAASGGYYVSCIADWIVANPATLTGSIGIYNTGFDLSELLAKIGVSHEVVKRGKLADTDSALRGWTEEEQELIQKLIEDLYGGFIERVAEGRDLDTPQVDALGQGRVWTGRQAKDRGLVDELGGLIPAIRAARARIGLGPEDEYRIISLPRARFSIGRLLKSLGLARSESDVWQDLLEGPVGHLVVLAQLGSHGPLAVMPYLMTIR